MKYITRYRLIIYVLLIVFTSIIVLFRFFDYDKNKYIEIKRKKIVDEKTPVANNTPTIDFESLRNKYNNKDIKGAIRISDENFEEIVFQGSDNNYYLEHDYRGKNNKGEIFIDYSLDIDNSKIKVLYGEGSPKTNIIKKYFNDEYYKSHKYLELETDKSIYKYEVLCVYKGNIDYKKFDMDIIIKSAIYTYNIEYDDNSEYLIFETKIDNSIISVIAKKVN